MSEILKIKVLNPRVKTILEELQALNLIEIDDTQRNELKAQALEKLSGLNLKNIDISQNKPNS